MKNAGFSLLELLVVVAIVGILAAASLPRFAEFRAAAYDARVQQDLRNLAAAQELHRAQLESYATDVAELGAFAPSEGVAIVIDEADGDGYAATGEHGSGRRLHRWDSRQDPPLTSTPR